MFPPGSQHCQLPPPKEVNLSGHSPRMFCCTCQNPATEDGGMEYADVEISATDKTPEPELEVAVSPSTLPVAVGEEDTPRIFRAVLIRGAEEKMGLTLDVWKDCLQVTGIAEDGAIATFNQNVQDEYRIGIHDVIFRVNGFTNMFDMREKLSEARNFKLMVARPRRVILPAIEKKDGEGWGLRLTHQPTSTCVMVQEILPGACESFNNRMVEAQGEEAVKVNVHDLIEVINDKRDNAKEMFEELKQAQKLTMQLLKLPSFELDPEAVINESKMKPAREVDAAEVAAEAAAIDKAIEEKKEAEAAAAEPEKTDGEAAAPEKTNGEAAPEAKAA